MREAVIIVDPFSSGAAYAPAFTERGYDCIAVRSSPDISPRIAKAFRPQHFVDRTLFDIEAALARWTKQPVKAVVAGCEMGVSAAEALASRLGLPGNSPDTTPLRRYKHDMQRALASAGLAHIPSMLIRQESEIDALLPQIHEGSWVVKPLNSASTEGVMFARGRDGVANALERCAWNRVNDLGEAHLGFVVQPFIQGREYVVDLVAHPGGITIASVCSYRKEARNGSNFVYVGLDVLDPHDPCHAALTDYAIRAARVLGLRVGPLHMELFASADGPVMIEAGARLHGGVAPELFRDCYAPHLLDLAVNAHLGGTVPTAPAQRVRHGQIVFLVNDQPCRFAGSGEDFLARLRALPSYRGHKLFVAEGDRIPCTVDLATCPGIVWLAGQDVQQIESDASACRALRLEQIPALS